jgi:hypothetical protein
MKLRLITAFAFTIAGATLAQADAMLDRNANHVTERAPVGAKASKQLGSVRNEVASTLLPGTRYDNIVNIGCGWASGVNFTSSYDWPSLLQSILSDPCQCL